MSSSSSSSGGSIKRTGSGNELNINWDNITNDDQKVRYVEMFLYQVEIMTELTNPNYNPDAAKLVIKKAIFDCMQKYKANGIQARVFQLLQGIHHHYHYHYHYNH